MSDLLEAITFDLESPDRHMPPRPNMPSMDPMVFDIVPLVYNDNTDISVITNVLLIDNSVQEYQQFVDGCNSTTFPIVYDYHSDRNELNQLLKRKFSSIQRIAFVFHNAGMNGKLFLNNQCFFNEADLETPDNFSENFQFLVDIIQDFGVGHVDYLACNSLQYDNWKQYYEVLKNTTNVVVGASNDATGNLQYGGDWVMESTNEDIKSTYFNDSINEYTKTLAPTTISTSTTVTNASLSGDIWPITISGGTALSPVVITFGDNITLNNTAKYFIIGSDYVTVDGNNKTVDVSGVTNGYLGLIQNGTNVANGKSNITVKNIKISSTNSILAEYGGWICQQCFCRGSSGTNIITNCTNSGNITYLYSGGIAGSFFAYQSVTGSMNTISNCTNNGPVSGNNAGGIAGQSFASQSAAGSINTITNCTNNGPVSGNDAGGISGTYFAIQSAGINKITNCTNSGSGNITSQYAGGIAGSYFANRSASGSINTITNCSNTGTVSGVYTGGIAGHNFAYQSTTGSINIITNCTNSGNITNQYAGGIAASGFANNSSGTNTITNCSNTGTVSGNYTGGIAGYSFAYQSTTGSINTIINCTNSGTVSGVDTGGIAGSGFAYGSSGTNKISNCYTLSGVIIGGISPPSTYLSNTYATTNAAWSITEAPKNLLLTDASNAYIWAYQKDASGVDLSNSPFLLYSLNPNNTPVPKIATSIIFTIQSPKTYGDASFTLQDVSSNSNVDFSYNSTNTAVATISSKTVTIRGVGATTISVSQAENSSYTAGYMDASFVVNKAITSIRNFSVPLVKTFGVDASFALQDPSSNSNVNFSYNSSNTAVATISGKVVTLVGPGSTTITVSQSENSNYTDGSASVTLTVINNITSGLVNNNNIYLKQLGDNTIWYSTINNADADTTGWIRIPDTCSITNTNATPSATNNLTVTFITNIKITNANQYFIIKSDYVTVDGNNKTVDVSGVTTSPFYPGLIQNGTNGANGKSNITVKNINISSTNSNLAQWGGWICQQYFCRGSSGTNIITNCTNTGTVSGVDTGGIAGYSFAYQSTTGSINTITNCTNSGNITYQFTGGITGAGFANSSSGTNTISNCTNSGNIINYAGGIAGGFFAYQSQTNSINTITNCSNSGTVSGSFAGGITGSYFADRSVAGSTIKISNCYTLSGVIIGGISPPSSYLSNTYATTNATWSISEAPKNLLLTDASNAYIWAYKKDASGVDLSNSPFLLYSLNPNNTPVPKITPTITWSQPSLVKTFGVDLTTFTFSQQPSSTNSNVNFSYNSSNTAVATISGSTVTLVGGGITTIRVYQAANSNYTDGSASVTLTVINNITSGLVNNNNIYLKQLVDNTIWYSTINNADADTTGWIRIPDTCSITNTNATPSATNNLTVTFITNIKITNQNQYFIIKSDYVTVDGSNKTVDVSGVTNGYLGLIQNGTSSAYGKSNIIIKNIKISSTNSSLAQWGGWICQRYFCYGSSGTNTITNCTNNGPISYMYSGGIAGDVFAQNTVSGSTTIISNCTNNGAVYGDNAGGIAGGGFALGSLSGSKNTITNCTNNGPVSGNYSGGIAGWYFALGASGINTITNCSNTGTVSVNAGGIAGAFFNQAGGSYKISNCYTIYGVISLNIPNTSNSYIYNTYEANGAWSTIPTLQKLLLTDASNAYIWAYQNGNGVDDTTIPFLLYSLNPNNTPVSQIITTINFAVPSPKIFGDASFMIQDLSSNSPAGFSYNSSNTSVATINAGKVTIVGSGNTTITVRQDVCGNYTDASASKSLVVNQAKPTINFTVTTPKTYGDASFMIQDLSSNSPADFSYNSSNTSVATINAGKVTIVGSGNTTITVRQDVCGNYTDASASKSLVVNQAKPTINFTVTTPKIFGDASFMIQDLSSNSPADFSYNSSNTSVATINAGKVTIVGAGSTTITVRQDACGNYTDASASKPLVVNQAKPTINFAVPSPKIFGDASFMIQDLSSNSPAGFSYNSSNTSVATINAGKVTIVGSGNTTITVRQDACGNYTDASASKPLVVNQAKPTINFAVPSPKIFGDASFMIQDLSSNSPAGFSYNSSNTSVATINAGKVTIVGSGNTTITVRQDACGNYTDASASKPLVVNQAATILSNFIIPTTISEHTTIQLVPPPSNNPSGAFTYTSSDTSVATIINNNQLKIVGNGTTNITATQAATNNYLASSITTKFNTSVIKFPQATDIQPNQITGTSEPNSTVVVTGTTINNQTITSQTQSNSQGIWNFNVSVPSNNFSFAPLNANQFSRTIASNYNMRYPQSKYTLTTNTPVSINPRQTGINPQDQRSWRISPKLPEGLKFSPITGKISGTPTAASASTTYNIWSISEVFLPYRRQLTIEIVSSP